MATIYLAVQLMLAVLYVAVPGLRPAIVAVAAVGSAGVIIGRAIQLRPPRRPGWFLIAASVLLMATGHALLVAQVGPSGAVASVPRLADAFYVAAYVPLAVGLLWLGRFRSPGGDWSVALDTAALAMAGSLVVWITLIRPYVVELDLSPMVTTTAIASSVGHVAAGAAAVRVLLSWRRSLSVALLAAGVVAFLVSDLFFTRMLLEATVRQQPLSGIGVIDLGYLAFIALCGASALTRQTVTSTSAHTNRQVLGLTELALLAVGQLVAPTVLFLEASRGTVTTGTAIAVASGVVAILIVVRLWMSAVSHNRREHREAAMRQASWDLVAATTQTQVVDGIEAALTAMLPARSRGNVRLEHTATPIRSDGELRPSPGDGGADRRQWRFVVPIRTEAEPMHLALVYLARRGDLLELTPTLRTLTDQAGLALERVHLAAQVRAAEREHYFRTLVQTSSDVVLISRNGRVDYATPSADAMFGYDVRGMPFADLVHAPPGDATAEPWPDNVDGRDGTIRRGDGREVSVRVHRRDLTGDTTIRGVVTTLHDTTAEHAARRDLAYRATHDALTGLANAGRFRALVRAQGGDAERRCGVLVIDLDDFKTVNDMFGHEVGDGLLVAVAERIRAPLRDSDVAARIGGDEFAVLLPDLPDPGWARALADRTAAALREPLTVNGAVVDGSASIGVAVARGPAEVATLLRRADVALYAAKVGGKGRWREYEAGMLSPIQQRADQRARLLELIQGGGLNLGYQPIVDLGTGRVIGFEALLRGEPRSGADGLPWTTQDLLRTADDTGLSIQLSEWVVDRVLHDVGRLNPPGTQERRSVGVNLSSQALRYPSFVNQLTTMVTASAVDPSLLVVEISENTPFADVHVARDDLARLRRRGVRVAIDDYGTGHASLSYLRQPGIDIIKLDRSFLEDIDSDRAQTLIEAVTRVAHRLGLEVIAEGVEDESTARALLALSCRYGQGFLFASALPLDEAVRTTHFPSPNPVPARH